MRKSLEQPKFRASISPVPHPRRSMLPRIAASPSLKAVRTGHAPTDMVMGESEGRSNTRTFHVCLDPTLAETETKEKTEGGERRKGGGAAAAAAK